MPERPEQFRNPTIFLEIRVQHYLYCKMSQQVWQKILERPKNPSKFVDILFRRAVQCLASRIISPFLSKTCWDTCHMLCSSWNQVYHWTCFSKKLCNISFHHYLLWLFTLKLNSGFWFWLTFCPADVESLFPFWHFDKLVF